jgi:hypothetical protein
MFGLGSRKENVLFLVQGSIRVFHRARRLVNCFLVCSGLFATVRTERVVSLPSLLLRLRIIGQIINSREVRSSSDKPMRRMPNRLGIVFVRFESVEELSK